MNAGEWVQIRRKEEILATLDKDGQLEGLPFMPEMFDFCGQRFRIFKKAHKTCDPPNGLEARRMSRAVHLDGVRCRGQFHGGCQARCLIFWKEVWLKPVDDDTVVRTEEYSSESMRVNERRVWSGTRKGANTQDSEDPSYVCQSTQIGAATQPLRWWQVGQYIEDYTSGNVRLSRILSSFLFFVYHSLATAGLGFGSLLRWSYDRFQEVRGGTPYPWRIGSVPVGEKTPSLRLNLQPGELVRIKSYAEIVDTLDEQGMNRGMWFDAEMVPYCGGTYRVLDRVGNIIDEKTGKMQKLKNECIILEDVVCMACYAKHRRFCPRSIYSYWREIWLERLQPNGVNVETTDR